MEIIIVFLGIIIDRITKSWAVNRLADGNDISIIKNFFGLSYLENRGAAFGILKGKLVFLTIITLIVIIALIIFLVKYRYTSKLLRISIACIISGALGNLIDRVKFKYVIDFILIHYKNIYYFPTFNIADVLVTTGTILLAIYVVKEEKNDSKTIFS